MKKNKMMRIASILMVATLITTCAISGTFAKYVTKAEAQDNARVAKWGIVISTDVTGVFAEKYKATDAKYKADGGEYSVETSVVGEKLVAPGTSSDEVGTLSGTLTGAPEVATRYSLVIENWEDVILPKGEGYTDYTEYKLGTGYGTFDLPADYMPVKWDITVTNGTKTVGLLTTAAEMVGTLPAGFNGFSVAEAKAIMTSYKTQLESLLESQITSGKARNASVEVTDEKIVISMDFDPNYAMNYTFALTWKWAFEGPMVSVAGPSAVTTFDAATVDMADTLLGNIAAGVATVEGANTTIAAKLTATAVQID